MNLNLWFTAIFCIAFPALSSADQVVEEIVVIGVRPSASATWFAQYMYYQTDLYQTTNNSISEVGGLEDEDPEDILEELDNDFGCNNSRIPYDVEMEVATAVYMSDLVGRGAVSMGLFFGAIALNEGRYEIDWPNGSTGHYTVGIALSAHPLTSRDACE